MNETKLHSILLIDDDEEEYDMIVEAAQETGKNVMVSYLDKPEQYDNYLDQDFDMILLDINMPYRDGFYWLRMIREKNTQIPVVMYSNSSNPGHISKAYREGASLFFNKPDSFTTLTKSISKLLELDWENLPEVKGGRFEV